MIDIEPATGPEASWVMPYLTSYGRVYVFYTYNAANMRNVIAETAYARARVDTVGEYTLKYSDDGGLSWSKERWYIPVRVAAIDRKNPYQGKVRFFWGVGKPIRHEGSMYLGFTKVGKLGAGFIAISEGWFLRCRNIETERDPANLQWLTLPEGDNGLKSPKGSIASEVNLTSLSDGSLFCTYRTVAGHPCHAYSRDEGRTWSGPAFMTYRPGGELVANPRAANFVWRLDDGPYAGRYIYWFHNHSGKSYSGRNPAYLLGGIEQDGPDGKVIHWGKPVATLYDKNKKIGISYPDFIWDDGLYITETQKTIARVHRIPDDILRSLWKDSDKKATAEQRAEGDEVNRGALAPQFADSICLNRRRIPSTDELLYADSAALSSNTSESGDGSNHPSWNTRLVGARAQSGLPRRVDTSSTVKSSLEAADAVYFGLAADGL